MEPLVGVIAFRPEASLLYINAETILEAVLSALQKSSEIKLVACDLSASPYIDLAGARMLRDLYDELASRHVDVLHRRCAWATARPAACRGARRKDR